MLLAQDYMPMWALVICLVILGMLSVAIPRFRRAELMPPEPDSKKKKKKKR